MRRRVGGGGGREVIGLGYVGFIGYGEEFEFFFWYRGYMILIVFFFFWE